MPRKPKYINPDQTIEDFYASVSDAYNSPGEGEQGRDGKKKQELLAEGEPPLPAVHLRPQLVCPVFELADEHHVLGLHVRADNLNKVRVHLDLVGDLFS